MSAAATFGSWMSAAVPGGGTRRMLVLGGVAGGIAGLTIAAACNVASPLVAGLGIVGLVVACGMMLSPTFAVLAMCFSIPFERLGRFTNNADAVAISLSRILGVIAIASLLLHAALRKKRLYFGTPFLLYAGYTFIAVLSNAWAFSPEDTFRDCFRVAGNLMFFFLIINVIRDFKAVRIAALLWLAASMAAGVYSLGDYYYFKSNPTTEAEMDLTSKRLTTVVKDAGEIRSLGTSVIRMYGPTAHPTLFGLNMAMTIPFWIWALRTSRRYWRLLCLAGLTTCSVCIVLSNTRAVMLVTVFIFLFCVMRGLLKLSAQGAVGLLVVGLIIAALIPEDVYKRSFDPSLYTASKGDSIRVRFKFWAKSWELIQQNWVHGIGLGNQTTIVNMITDEDTGYLTSDGTRASAHNEYIWVMVEVGIFGYLFHWFFVGAATRSSFLAAALFRRQHEVDPYLFSLACQVLMVSVLLFALQTEVFHYPLKGWWLIAALSCTALDVARNHQAVLSLQPAEEQVQL